MLTVAAKLLTDPTPDVWPGRTLEAVPVQNPQMSKLKRTQPGDLSPRTYQGVDFSGPLLLQV